MSARIILCVDSASCVQPAIVGLDGEQLDAQAWIDIAQTGEEARSALSEGEGYDEAWVLSSDDVEPINLAATLKGDCPGMRVCLVGNGDGSMRSRAYTANIDEVMSVADFVEAYRRMKARFGMQASPQSNATDIRVRQPHVEPDEGSLSVLPTSRKALLPRVDGELPNTKGKGFLMPVVSGSGGAGKSAISTIAALVAHRAGYRTLLLDYDLQFGDVAAALGISDAPPIDELVAHPDTLDRLCATGSLPAVATAPARMETADSLAAEMPEFLSLLRMRFDVIIANTGAAWTEHHATILEQSNVALFLVDQRASSLKACKHALQLCSRCGIASSPFRFALNRCARNGLLTSIDVSCALRGAPVFELRDGGPAVEEYFASGAALQLVEEGNELCSSVASMLSKLLPEGEQKLEALSSDIRQRRGSKRRGRFFPRGGEGA